MISVIIVLKKPTKFLEKNLFCFSKQKNKKFEVILISENDIEINQNFNFKLKTLKSKTNLPGPKRHLGAENAQGEILAFIDDDAYPDEKWIDTIYKTVKSKNSITGPAISPKYEKLSVLKNLYSSIYFSKFFGGAQYRYFVIKKKFELDDFASVNFALKKEDYFDTIGFNSKFWPGEDSLLANDMRKKKITITYIPDLVVEHERRSSFNKFIKQIFRYSYTRGYFAKNKISNSLKFKYFIPSILLIVFILGVIFKVNLILNFILLYLLIVFVGSLEIILKVKKLYMVFSFIFIFIGQLIYGYGFLKGIIAENYNQDQALIT